MKNILPKLLATIAIAVAIQSAALAASTSVSVTAAANPSFAGGPITPSSVKASTDGTGALPVFSWVSDPDTGIYRDSANVFCFATNGTGKWCINSSGALVAVTNGGVDIGNGSSDPRDINLTRSVVIKGSTSGSLTIKPAATAGTSTLTLPGGTTDFSATGGTSQFVKQASAGAALTLARPACADLSDATAACSTSLGTGVATALGVNVGSAGAPVLFNGAGGTPSSITLTNASGTAASLTAGTASAVAVGGITGLGTGVATFLATPSSANFAAAITDEIGTSSVMLGSEGTWTPTILIGGVEPTSYETRYGSYTKVGNRMCVNARVQILVVGAATGSVTIGGLPAASKDVTYNQTAMSILAFALTGLTTESLQAQVTNNASEIQIHTFSLGTVTPLPHTKLAADAGFIVGGCYPL